MSSSEIPGTVICFDLEREEQQLVNCAVKMDKGLDSPSPKEKGNGVAGNSPNTVIDMRGVEGE